MRQIFPSQRLSTRAKSLSADGADLVDVGCNPGGTWHQVGDAVRAIVDEGDSGFCGQFKSD